MGIEFIKKITLIPTQPPTVPTSPCKTPLQGFFVDDLYGKARPCNEDCLYVSEEIGISPNDFIIWDAGFESFQSQVTKETTFDIEVLGEGGI